MFDKESSKKKDSPLSIAVPGELAGLYTAHKEYGKIPWESLVKPAENLARNGFIVSSFLSKTLASVKSTIMSNKELRSVFAPKGRLVSKGKTIYFKKLADTLASVSKHGMNDFYNGSIAQSLSNDIQKAGGIIKKEDFQKYRAITRKPLVANVFGYEIVTAPPPASGGAMLILILKILSNYKATGEFNSLELHRFVEALKYALAMKTSLGDPQFANVTNILEKMISTSYAKVLKSRINDTKTYDPAHYGSKYALLFFELLFVSSVFCFHSYN
ncbi:PREDICTED: gamma-glutamyltranspeptidase 2-like [Erythranthe guttata]|uniref:gamma-glutamyltranspeptidase 2-like n=1 Tax=Erythranthe guttata TaxID=4155 RepID=UPI00064DB8CF|nr:PREDICTED: gamma-glutamyltranspeptidase 2-like [Erythranthe guttata]|eukprot:XP_012831123.1 PREDICTED: gamma-glutamyltranspeptidase 2-like [Erythranthe guttata]